MKTTNYVSVILLVVNLVFTNSCSVIDKSSKHGFGNGYYKFKSTNPLAGKVYVDVDDQKLDVYPEMNDRLEELPVTISLSDSDFTAPLEFTKRSLDIDLTTILLKYRPSVDDLPVQMMTDFNMALYAGWRHDKYSIQNSGDDPKKKHPEVIGRGYDFGLFAGPGTTVINPFSTKNRVENDYNGMILQYGVAGFVESDIASFGIAAGYDFLLSPDRKIWIYNKKPWFGLIIGIALN